MSIITLSANDTRSIPLGGYLRIDAYSVGGGATPVRLSVHGDQARANTAGDSSVFLMSLPHRASLVVSPVGGGEFGPDQSVRVTIARSGASDNQNLTLEFPLVRVDGVSEKIVGDIANVDGHYQITAFGSDESTNLGHESMVVLSALRSRLGAGTSVSAVVVDADASASAAHLADERVLAGAGNIIVGIATALDLDEVGIGDQKLSLDRIGSRLADDIASGTTRIGSGASPRVSDDALVVHLTPAPRGSMFSDRHPTVVIAYGPTAAAEMDLFSPHVPEGGRTGFITLDEELLSALDSGNANAFAPHADTIAAALRSTDATHGVTE